MEWTDYRALFSAPNHMTYLDAAAIGAPPLAVTAAAQAAHGRLSAEGSAAIPWLLEGVEATRTRAAELLSVERDAIGFTDSTSASMNWLAMMATDRRGARDRVVLLRDEFPSSTLPWMHHGFEPVWVEPGPDNVYDPQRILDAVDDRTRAVVTSLVQYRTGARTDVASLADPLRRRGVWHVVNATQGVGAIPFDASPYAAVTVTALKWLCAGLGNGILCLSPELRAGRAAGGGRRWPLAGWVAQEDFLAMENARLRPRLDAASVELGGADMARLHALGAAIETAQRVGVGAIEARILSLSRRLREGLLARGARVLTPADDARRAGIVTALRPDAEAWHLAWMERGLIQSLRGATTIRFSAHAYNDEGDIDRALEAWSEGA